MRAESYPVVARADYIEVLRELLVISHEYYIFLVFDILNRSDAYTPSLPDFL
jgi:hypothetical protein